MSVLEQTERPATGHAAVLDFYGLSQEPFGVTPDPRFLYFSPSHREALASLIYTTQTKRGFSTLVAEPGMGKTTLLFYLLEKIKGTARTAFLFRPGGDPRDLLESLLADLGINAIGQTIAEMHENLGAVLLDERKLGRDFVWVVDEAQNLETSVLETIRLLSNFETPNAKLMHIILAGQPALAEKLAQPDLLQLRQRVSRIVQLAPLSVRETSEYVAHRLRLCGRKDNDLFQPGAIRTIASASEGIPRNINNLCFACLSLGFVERAPRIGVDILQVVLSDYGTESKPADERVIPPAPEPISTSRSWFEHDIDTGTTEANDRPTLGVVPSGMWIALLLIGLILVPLGLVIAQANSGSRQFDLTAAPAVEALISRLTGYDVGTPGPPVSDAPALRPPAVPANLPELDRELALPESTIEEVDALTPIPAGHRNATALAVSQARRVVRADRDQTIFQFAQKYYGRASWTIVERLRDANPNIRESFATIKKGQVVVLPDQRRRQEQEFPNSSSHRSP